jgi:NDP-sugar pyrophosphorylase family protein
MQQAALAFDALENFLAMHGDVFWRLDAQAHLIAVHPEHGHDDVGTNHDSLTDVSRDYQHRGPPP